MNRTDFIAAVECNTKGWHQAHNSQELDDDASFAIEQHNELKKFARNLYPHGTLVSGDGRIDTTRQLVSDPDTDTIYDATIRAGAFTATVDILSRHGDGWAAIAVKSSFSNKKKLDAYVDAIAYQVMVLRRSGVAVTRSMLLLLSRDYQRGHPAGRLFVPVDKTHEVNERTQVFEQRADAIAVAVGAAVQPESVFCRACWSCDFFKAPCFGPERGHTVVELPVLHPTRRNALCKQGVIDIADIPGDLRLNDTQQRARRAMESGQVIISEGLASAIADIKWPCYYLDFETLKTTLPLYHGYACHAQVLTQFSIHYCNDFGAEPLHSEFLARAEEGQERTLAEHLIRALGNCGAIVVYGNFEEQRIKELAARVPELTQPLSATLDRLVDFEKIIKKHVYHPAFGGSFSLKKVVPALLPDVSYDGLDINNGTAAMRLFAQMVRGEVEDVEGARRNLLAYCETDTLVMVKLHEVLAEMAREL